MTSVTFLCLVLAALLGSAAIAVLIPHHHHLEELTHDNVRELHNEGECNARRFARCGKIMFRRLGIRRPTKDFILDYAKAIERILSTQGGKKGWTRICGIGREFAKCGGKDVVPGCFNVQQLMKLGLTAQQAYAVAEIREQMAYECTDGFKVIANDKNWKCYNATVRKEMSAITACITKFKQEVAKKPKDICPALGHLDVCMSNLFTKDCNKALGNNICNVMARSLRVQYPKCRVRCPSLDDDDVTDDDTTEIDSAEVNEVATNDDQQDSWLVTDSDEMDNMESQSEIVEEAGNDIDVNVDDFIPE